MGSLRKKECSFRNSPLQCGGFFGGKDKKESLNLLIRTKIVGLFLQKQPISPLRSTWRRQRRAKWAVPTELVDGIWGAHLRHGLSRIYFRQNNKCGLPIGPLYQTHWSLSLLYLIFVLLVSSLWVVFFFLPILIRLIALCVMKKNKVSINISFSILIY